MKHLRFHSLGGFLCAFAAVMFMLSPLALAEEHVQAVLAEDMSITGNFAQAYTVSNWYSSAITINGGVRDFTYNITEGELPPGFFVRLDSSYIYLEGKPNQAGTYTFTIRITDRRNCYAER
ncbi:MAG: putative Ig domain-containing protein [Synergistaceae bacterium]|nr:putative Ig domain-containing protein [Synergistaceae bacterium]